MVAFRDGVLPCSPRGPCWAGGSRELCRLPVSDSPVLRLGEILQEEAFSIWLSRQFPRNGRAGPAILPESGKPSGKGFWSRT